MRRLRPLHLAASLAAIIIILFVSSLCLPLVGSWLSAQQDDAEILGHLFKYLLPEALLNSVVLTACVAFGCVAVGTSLAYIVTFYDIPGRRFFRAGLFLPMALPSYVLAFVYCGIFDYSGFGNQLLSTLFTDVRFFGLPRNIWTCAFVLILGLYPYLYFFSLSAFESMGQSHIKTAKCLGVSKWRMLRQMILPLVSPWIFGGLVFICLETLAEFGAVSIFGVSTMATLIYRTWYGLFSLDAALQVANILLVICLLFYVAGHGQRRKQYINPKLGQRIERQTPGGLLKLFMIIFPVVVLVLGVLVPVVQLLAWAVSYYKSGDALATLKPVVGQSVAIAGMSAALVVAVAGLLNVFQRYYDSRLCRFALTFTTLGYAIPGSVLAVILLRHFTALEQGLQRIGVDVSLTGTVIAVVLGLSIRFFALGSSVLTTSLQRIPASLDRASKVIGLREIATLWVVYWPSLRLPTLIAASLVFVDVIKEMPLTLMTRPFGWATLSTKIFEYTAESQWQQAAAPSLFLIVCGLIPVGLMALSPKRQPNVSS